MKTTQIGARRGVRLAAAAAAVAVGMVMAMPEIASAAPTDQQACKVEANQGNACITIGSFSEGYWLVHGGVDFIVSPGYGQQLINQCGTSVITAELWGDDGSDSDDDFLAHVPLKPGWPAAGGNLISAEFEWRYLSSLLDEDNGTDEVMIRFYLYDCNGNPRRRLDTPNIVHNF